MGWEQLLNLNCEKIYRRVVIEWMSSLTRNGDELSGIVDGRCYSITPAVIREVLGVDTRKDVLYGRFSEIPNGRRWVVACNTIFGPDEDRALYEEYESDGKQYKIYEHWLMTPLAQILWEILFSELHRDSTLPSGVWPREIYLLHAFVTGDYLYSFALLMIDDIWNMYEDENQHNIPHGSYISIILNSLGAVSKDECAEMVSPEDCIVSRRTFGGLLFFSESSSECALYDDTSEKDQTFPKWDKWAQEREKHVEEREGRAQEREKRVEEREKKAEEAEIQAQERERRAQEMEKRAQEREKLVEEMERRAQERGKKAEESEIWVQEREKRVEEMEREAKERERKAEIRFQETEKRVEEMERRVEEKEKKAEIRFQEMEKRVEEMERRVEEREKKAEIRCQETETRVETEAQAQERGKRQIS
ncbi:uncharacterized protein [Rutidosis leptorrhynchoides]|uniref:uncharacterized protein n=1 Tax=Rutidosis leptorrhynchoides TaxID=125765 RepID=UPI003A99E154